MAYYCTNPIQKREKTYLRLQPGETSDPQDLAGPLVVLVLQVRLVVVSEVCDGIRGRLSGAPPETTPC